MAFASPIDAPEILALSLEDLCLYPVDVRGTTITTTSYTTGVSTVAAEIRDITPETAKRKRKRITFEDFTAQIRSQRRHEKRRRILSSCQYNSHCAVNLSARLHRIGHVLQKGLVDSICHGDKSCFVQVYQTAQDLKDNVTSCWKCDASRPPTTTEEDHPDLSDSPGTPSTLTELAGSSRAELSELIHLQRSDPAFLVERIKGLSQAQLAALLKRPKYPDDQDNFRAPFTRTRSQQPQQRASVIYTNELKEYAHAFERSDPLAYLLFNIYGVESSLDHAESQLRLNVWSSVCAQLYMEPDKRYQALINTVLSAFASLHEWRAKQRLEFYMVELLQKSSVMLESLSQASGDDFTGHSGSPEIEGFVAEAVRELFGILNDQDGGLPYGALHFGSAILGKLSVPEQSSFRGDLFYGWFFGEHLRVAMHDPEMSGMLLHSYVHGKMKHQILNPIWLRARDTFYAILTGGTYAGIEIRSAEPLVTTQAESMVGRLIDIQIYKPELRDESQKARDTSRPSTAALSPVIILSISDILTGLEALFPTPQQPSSPWDPFMDSSAATFALQYGNKPSKPVRTVAHDFAESYSRQTTPVPLLRPNRELHSASSSWPTSSWPDPVQQTSNQYKQLRQDLTLLLGQDLTIQLPHPCDEIWLLFTFDAVSCLPRFISGAEVLPEDASTPTTAAAPACKDGCHDLDAAQEGAIRLVKPSSRMVAAPASNISFTMNAVVEQTLHSQFETEIQLAQNQSDVSDIHYWFNALDCLRHKHHAAYWGQDDTKVFQPVYSASQVSEAWSKTLTQIMEDRLAGLETLHKRLRHEIETVFTHVQLLRDKMWYKMDVMHSEIYEGAKEVAHALTYMQTQHDVKSPGSVSSRGRVQVRSFTDMLFQRQQTETSTVMKASSEHGGPRKLADEQVDLTRKWLKRSAIDNFCRGEERIHRFCMEMKTASGKLVGDNMTDSPVLWSSECFSREKHLFDNVLPKPALLSNSERRYSALSEDNSRSLPLRPSDYRPRASDARSSPSHRGSVRSMASTRMARSDAFNLDLSPAGASPTRRAVSETTTESTNSFWSPVPTDRQSMTSISSHSRPSSMYNDAVAAKAADDMSLKKTKFLDNLRHSLVTLLVSDLACPVWSSGSETDSWLDQALQREKVRRWLKRRHNLEHAISSSPNAFTPIPSATGLVTLSRKRSSSARPVMAQLRRKSSNPTIDCLTNATQETAVVTLEAAGHLKFSYNQAFQQLLDRFCKEPRPALKLQAVQELEVLAITQMKETRSEPTKSETIASSTKRQSAWSTPASRRSSLNATTTRAQGGTSSASGSISELTQDSTPSEEEIVQKMKEVLVQTRPRSLFRDLQYVSAFASPDELAQKQQGKAFLHLGLAALAYKEDICSTLVELASKMIAADGIKRQTDKSEAGDSWIKEAAEYLMFAAREGNAVAQRELASLYLVYGGIIPVMTTPLSLPRETFRPEMMYWQEKKPRGAEGRALCLALHWMQQAADNGDEIARGKLKEREGTNSIL